MVPGQFFMVPDWFSWFFMVPDWFFMFFMIPMGFSWFFMVPGWFFMVPVRFIWFFMVPGWFFMVFLHNVPARTVSWPDDTDRQYDDRARILDSEFALSIISSFL